MQELLSLRNIVRRYLTDGIADGSFCPGDKISEQSICNALGVSRTPAREAMLQLNSEGLLDYFPRRGFYIRMVSEKEQADIYELLGLLDAYCAMTAVSSISATEITRMKEIADKIDIAIKYRNVEEYGKLQRDFHWVYRQKNTNELILSQISNAESGVVPAVFIGDSVEKLAEVYSIVNEEHREIISMFEKGDATALYYYLVNTHWGPRFPQLTKLRTRAKSL
ncbi:MAG: GntR family transcriptional regulator [Clostridiales bacterium]|nr:GntR family transcriptional regulator [Clostridiales bacterium]